VLRDYVILTSRNHFKLETLVLDYSDKGWELSGGVSVCMVDQKKHEMLFVQAMILKEG